ncbi:TIGR03086 family metal-binding protein [Rhodococcoides trifolii]|nr:TIGR03086 family metal-binding protein [Rhodococcus trifolii]
MQTIAELAPAERHRLIATGFGEHVGAVTNWDAPTPVDGWVARDIVTHLVEWSRAFLRAGDLELADDPSIRTDPVAAWAAHRAEIQGLLDGPGADDEFTHPYAGTHRLGDAIDRFYTTDIFMHTWDLATARGADSGLDPDFAAHVVDGMSGIEEILRSSGQYGPAVSVPADSDPVTRLVGFIGRDPKWTGRTGS